MSLTQDQRGVPAIPVSRPLPGTGKPAAMKSGLQQRPLRLLLAPLSFFFVVSVYFDYQAAGNAALQQHQQLRLLAPKASIWVWMRVLPRCLGTNGCCANCSAIWWITR